MKTVVFAGLMVAGLATLAHFGWADGKPKYHFGDNVVVLSGFYQGCQGAVVAEKDRGHYYRYDYAIEFHGKCFAAPDAWFHEEDLSPVAEK